MIIDNSDVIGSVIQNIDVLRNLFATMMRETAPSYLPLARGWDDKAKERAIDAFADKTAREALFTFYRQLQNLYDILSPDAFLRPYIADYQALAELFALIRNAYADRVYVDKELTAKTKALLREHTTGDNLELPGAIHELGPQELAALRDSAASATTKILNLTKVLKATIDQEGGSKPFLLSIGERAADLAERYEDRQLTTQQMLVAFQALAQEYVEADAERARLGLGANGFAIYRVLRPLTGDEAVAQAGAIDAVFGQYPDYRWNQGQQSQLRTDLYRALRPLVGAGNMIATTNALLRMQRV